MKDCRQSALRDLRSNEVELVAGGTGGEPIVVVGTRLAIGAAAINWVTFNEDGSGEEPHPTLYPEGSEGGGGAPTDEESVDITINIYRPLTEAEKAAVENMKATIAAIEAAIKALPNNALLILPNGASVTAADLKAIWAKTDFVINDNSFVYLNNGQGEADPNWGNPKVSFNIGYLDQYDDFTGGMNYLVAHELGHLTQAGTSFYTDQRTANDISRALLNGAGLAYLNSPEPEYGYSWAAPTQFWIP